MGLLGFELATKKCLWMIKIGRRSEMLKRRMLEVMFEGLVIHILLIKVAEVMS